MLILVRRPGESVKIGDDTTVTVIGLRGNQVRLGFSAPKNVTVHRAEIYRRIRSTRLGVVSVTPEHATGDREGEPDS